MASDNTASGSERIRITYELTCAPGEDPHRKAQDVAFEQTVELPGSCVSPEIQDRIVGRIESIERADDSRWRTVIAFPPVVVGGEVPQLLNVLFGNISLKTGVLVAGVELPPATSSMFPGPRFGIDGLRRVCGGVAERPLLCTALKPVGLSSEELAELCFRFAVAGIDIIKDDHGLANQDPAPFRERVTRCQEAVCRANAQTGGRSLYFPNLASRVPEVAKDIDFVRSVGCRGVLLSPLLLGMDMVRWIAETSDIAILAHPAMAGAFFQPNHGIVPDVLLGQLFRLIGSDGVIYPNVGGRFAFSEKVCHAINYRLRKPAGTWLPSFPVPAGGIDVERVPYWLERYGVDTIFLIGSSLYAQSDLVDASRRLVEAVRRN